jgi:hypothetical protein
LAASNVILQSGNAYAYFDLDRPESSWELSEPDIGYQAIDARLGAAFAR